MGLESHDGMNGLHDGFDAFYNSVADALALRGGLVLVYAFIVRRREIQRDYT